MSNMQVFSSGWISGARIGRASAGLLVALLFSVLLGCTPEVKEIREAGVELYRAQQYTEAMATFRHALELSPSDAESNYYMGLSYRVLAARKFRDGDIPAARRQLDRAIVYFTQAVKSWPNYMAAISEKNSALELRGKYDAALAVAETATRQNRGVAEHFIYLGDEYRQRADYDNALRAYKTALAIDPSSARAYAGMGRLYQQVGNIELAADSFRRAREIDPREAGPDELRPPEDAGVRTASHLPAE